MSATGLNMSIRIAPARRSPLSQSTNTNRANFWNCTRPLAPHEILPGFPTLLTG